MLFVQFIYNIHKVAEYQNESGHDNDDTKVTQESELTGNGELHTNNHA